MKIKLGKNHSIDYFRIKDEIENLIPNLEQKKKLIDNLDEKTKIIASIYQYTKMLNCKNSDSLAKFLEENYSLTTIKGVFEELYQYDNDNIVEEIKYET